MLQKPLVASLWLCSLLSAQTPSALVDFVEAHCITCHGGDTVKGKLDLRQPADSEAAELWRWQRLRDRVHSGEMPPPDQERIPAAARHAFAAAVDDHVRRQVPRLPVDPGRTTLRRLSRRQWANCVRDLFGIAADTGAFPADDLGYGFDTVGSALTFSTLHLEKYLAAAAAVAAEVFDGVDPARPARQRFEAVGMPVLDGSGVVKNGESVTFTTNAVVGQVVVLPRDGIYRLRLSVGADQAGTEPAKLVLRLDGRELDTIDIEHTRPRPVLLTLPMAAGQRAFEIAFVNDHYEPQHPDPKQRDRNLRLELFEVEGPLDARPVPSERAWLGQLPAAATAEARLRQLAAALLPRVWRRPVADEETARMVGAALQDGGPSPRAERYLLTAALLSPHFLFRVEAPPAGAVAGSVVALTPTQLASRLSFFLWASTPDPQLMQAAAAGRLTGGGLSSEVDRLLADPRAESLATEFAAQWFELASLADRTPDPARFPGFDDRLRASMRRQTELLFWTVLRENLDVRRLLDADFTYVDVTLAGFLGWPAPAGPGFERVQLAPERRERGGLLGHPSVHAITSNPTRTSPVKRGKWILENLLGQAPPPPPPGNDSLANEAAVDSGKSFREQLALHRERSACAVCHVRMDAIGFALENYDAIGRRRERDAGGVIDSRAELPDGTRLAGVADLVQVIARDPAFVRTVVHKLFVYANGRELLPADRLRLGLAIERQLAGGVVTLRDLLLVVVLDDAFMKVRIEVER
ncbi:MAG: DUF1592 domain-containing protein [Planctomycetes bacterium]|jgi:hypothetical protein|nr:DUF1592 domain-containing protein [Planctomycetota bacterium]